jgi:thiosulfate/3-mercaptopyruvate sulfurtransferase
MKKIPIIIDTKDLLLLNPNDYILIDASAGSRNRYHINHLKGALFIDVNTDLAKVGNFENGGRHPLPSKTQFGITLGNLGITKNSHVIIYDDKNAYNAAARFWWMLKSVGHDKVQVLNGGYNFAIDEGFPTNSETENPKPTQPYPISTWRLPLADINEVENASRTSNYLIIDVRDANRFAGLVEPIDLIAGHIPGAINIPFTENLDSAGNFLPPEILKEKYTKVFSDIHPDNIIVHCGSGITACHTLLAIAYAELPIPKLYVGSWSEWSRNNKEMILAKF